MKHLLSVAVLGVMMSMLSAAGNAASNMLFILDASNSMWGQVDGVAKLKTAKQVMTKLLKDLPADTKVGLIAYGHRAEGDCADVETLSAIGSGSAESLIGKINGLTAKGKTPIAQALRSTAAEFANLQEENNNVVLISDGIESCQGDPCEVAQELVAQGINVKVHVVGFDVDEAARAQLQCIAEKGNGRYFDASDAAGLQQAAADVQQAVQTAEAEPTAPPPPPSPKEVFFDDFKGGDLAEHWEVINPNPDAFIVEDGELLILSNKVGSLADDNVGNLFRLTTPLPAGDWILSAKLRVKYQTLKEIPFFGIYQDKGSYIVAGVTIAEYCCDYTEFSLNNWKSAGGDVSTFNQVFLKGPGRKKGAMEWADALSPHYFKLVKSGRSYTFSIKMGDGEDAVWTDLPKLTSLKAAGGVAIGLTQAEKTGGESLAHVDWVRIEVPE